MRHPTGLLLAIVVLVAACGSDDAEPAGAPPPESASASTTTTFDSPPPPTEAVASTDMPPPEQGATTTIESSMPDETTGDALIEITVELPAGSLEFDPGDVIVAEATGDLAVYRGLLTDATIQPELLADYPEPTGPVTEGPGPNVVDDVAGLIDGALIFSDCCEPISGNVLAAPGDPAAVRPIAPGSAPALSPGGSSLAAASSGAIQRFSTADGTGVARLLDQSQRIDGFLNVDDIEWIDDERLVVLGWDDAGYGLYPVDPETLEVTEPVRFDLAFDGTWLVRFAGRGPAGELAVSAEGSDSTDLRYFAADDLDEDPLAAQSFSPTITSIRLAGDGTGLLYVDGNTLSWLAGGSADSGSPRLVDPIRLADGVSAAWFATPQR